MNILYFWLIIGRTLYLCKKKCYENILNNISYASKKIKITHVGNKNFNNIFINYKKDFKILN